MSQQEVIDHFFRILGDSVKDLIPIVSYVGRSRCGALEVMKARLFFAFNTRSFNARTFEGAGLVAETFHLSGMTAREFVERVASGKLCAPKRELIFPLNMNAGVEASLNPLHDDGIEQQKRLTILSITGGFDDFPTKTLGIDWSLKGATPPYDSLAELFSDFGVGPLTQPSALFEAVATPLLEIDISSRVEGAQANIGVVVAPSLAVERISVGYRVFDHGQIASRGVINAEDFAWETGQDMRQGRATIAVPPAAAVHCYARYGGIAQHHYWIADPSISQNPHRATYERYDPGLDVLRDMLVPRESRNAGDLEKGVAWLFWLLGFSVIHMGDKKRLSEGPDIIAVTPAQHYAVIECTMGLLKGETKMERLVARAAAVRERLEKSNNRHLRVLPIMATSMTRAEIAAGLQPAREQGVLVLAREDLLEACDRTLLQPTPDILYANAEQSVR